MAVTDTRKAWVAFNADGFPFGFLTDADDTIAQVAKEFPTAHRIELLDTADWKHQLRIHSGEIEA